MRVPHHCSCFMTATAPTGGSPWGFTSSPSSAPPPPILSPHVCILTALPALLHYWTPFSGRFSDHSHYLATRRRLQLKRYSARERHKKETSTFAFMPLDEYFSSEWWLSSLSGWEQLAERAYFFTSFHKVVRLWRGSRKRQRTHWVELMLDGDTSASLCPFDIRKQRRKRWGPGCCQG